MRKSITSTPGCAYVARITDIVRSMTNTAGKVYQTGRYSDGISIPDIIFAKERFTTTSKPVQMTGS